MAEIVLFGSPLSGYVQKVMGALRYKKLEYERVELRAPGDLKQWNPVTGKMPVLGIRGERLYDSTFILDRLDEWFPEPPLLSADPILRARQRMIEDWSDESLYWYIMALRWSPRNAGTTAAQITASLPAVLRPLARRVVRRQIAGATRAQGLGRLPSDVVVRELGGRLDDLLTLLGTRPFFGLQELSRADLAVAGMLEMGLYPGSPEVGELVAACPALGAYLARVRTALS